MYSAPKGSRARVAVIGCGIFGAMVALRLREAGHPTVILERHDRILNGASSNNQNRLHLGFHYPRDLETARQCLKGFERFREAFDECLVGNFTNAYFIAEAGSLTSPADYLTFCGSCGLDYRELDPSRFEVDVRGVALGILADEPVYDQTIFRLLVEERLRRGGVDIRVGHEVTGIDHGVRGYRLDCGNGATFEVDRVVNCSYADINRLTAMLGHGVPDRRYEYTMTPIIRWPRPPVGITIMDGPFCSLLPYGKTGDFLLYHVDHSVVASATAPFLDRDWLSSDRAPPGLPEPMACFEATRAAAVRFIPALEEAVCVGYLRGPRMVLANRDDTDARPSIVQGHGDGYVTVFSGKVAHCMWVGEEVFSLLQ
jgi:glycine/D-amino acid oxidase-like deaminating enzyme